MFLILTVLVLIAVAVAFIAKRQVQQALSENQTPKYIDGENLRPLFAPDEEDLRAQSRAEEESANEQAAEQAREAEEKRLASFEEFRQTWRESPDRAGTIELLRRGSEIQSGKVFLDTVDEILHMRIETLTRSELAELIESHFWLLPQSERTPGVSFTINKELSALRAGSKAMSEEEASDSRS